MKAVVLGKGQLGSYIEKHWNNFNNIDLTCLSHSEFDITDFDKFDDILKTYEIIINCTGYLNLERAEKEDMLLNYDVNQNGPAALFSKTILLKPTRTFIHISTDFVYGSNDPKYNFLKEDTEKTPLNFYAQAKFNLDEFFEKLMNRTTNTLVLRPCWLFGPNSKNNFESRIIDLLTTKKKIKVVNDQIGTPTSVRLVDKIIKEYILGNVPNGIYNVGSSDKVSRYENACYVKELIKSNCEILPCTLEELNRPVKIQKNSCLDCSKIRQYIKFDLPSWKTEVEDMIYGRM